MSLCVLTFSSDSFTRLKRPKTSCKTPRLLIQICIIDIILVKDGVFLGFKTTLCVYTIFSNIHFSQLIVYIVRNLPFCGQIYYEACHMRSYEPRHKKTSLRDFRSGPTQTELYSHKKGLTAGNFGFRKKRDGTIHVAKRKALICVFFAHMQK